MTTANLSAPGEIGYQPFGPDGAAPDTCWGLEYTPAVIQTVTEHVLVSPQRTNPDGSVSPASYDTITRQEIVEDRGEKWFETPCASDLTPDFIASLQRALQIRGYLQKVPNGILDTSTRNAIRRFQRDQGLNSDVLSMTAAQQLGLVAYGREEFGMPAPH